MQQRVPTERVRLKPPATPKPKRIRLLTKSTKRRVKKLMALADSPNANEGSLARSKALAIMADHGIDPHAVDSALMTRAPKRTLVFTDLGLKKTKAPPQGKQLELFDSVQRGLSILISSGGAKTFRSRFQYRGKWHTRSIGRLGENSTATGENFSVRAAREQCRLDRALAHTGVDPRVAATNVKQITDATRVTVEKAITEYIEIRCKPRQRTWDQTEGFLKRALTKHLKRPVTVITSADCEEILADYYKTGRHASGQVVKVYMQNFFEWLGKPKANNKVVCVAVARDLMRWVGDDLPFKKAKRSKVYSPAEIKSTWSAAAKLSLQERIYTQLMILLCPRATSLALAKWEHFNDDFTLWTVPDELVKRVKTADERVYRVPLPKIARDILKRHRRGKPGDRLFPALPIEWTKGGRPAFLSDTLKRHLTENGAPSRFGLHRWRHTATSFLEDQGFDAYDRQLMLNHKNGEGAVNNYSHGHAYDRKLGVIEAWCAHVAKCAN